MDDWTLPKPRLALLLDHFATIEDVRAPWRVAYPLREVLFLVVCATIANCDDYEDIADWGEANLEFLRRFSEFHYGIPCPDWLRALINRIDPDLFSAAFRAWVAEGWPGRAELVAIDGKTSRRSHDRRVGKGPLHLVSAFATNSKLVLGQEAVDEKSNEIVAIPALLAQLDLQGALVSIDAIGCNPTIAKDIIEAGADYLLAVKENQPTLHAEAESYFATAPEKELDTAQSLDKAHGRLEIRAHKVSRAVDWIGSARAFPGAKRFPNLAVVAMVEARIERKDKTSCERRYYISSRALSAEAFAEAVRSHWAIENSLHWVLDVTFKEDLSRLRVGHGARNMAVVRHFALNLLRLANDKRAIKRRRKVASWNHAYLMEMLQITAR
ncbi:MAG: ISAs1 family transposase [Caulobacteraceae bacterium]